MSSVPIAASDPAGAHASAVPLSTSRVRSAWLFSRR